MSIFITKFSLLLLTEVHLTRLVLACSRRLDCAEKPKMAPGARVGAREDWEGGASLPILLSFFLFLFLFFFSLAPYFSFARRFFAARHKLNAWNRLAW